MGKQHVLKRLILLLIAITVVSTAVADVRLPGVFGDQSVLQRDQKIPVWGWAEAGEKVVVSLGGQEKTVSADADGKWMTRLDAMAAGGPYTLKVEGKNVVERKEILIGEVWLCSGQSNMAMAVKGCINFDAEQAAANLPKIRMMTVDRKPAESPQDDCGGSWVVCSPETVGSFSATAYFFGRELHKELGVPVGLINSSWGGTPVQSWTSRADQDKEPKLKELLEGWDKQVADFDPEKIDAEYEKKLAQWKERAEKAKTDGEKAPNKPRKAADPRMSAHRPANLYNGMIAPLAPYGIRGGIWYQGESNAQRYTSRLYGMQLATMIENWRRDWGQGDFPFEWVQLPNFRAPQTEPSQTTGWVTVQEEMLKTLAVPNTGMAVTIDIGMEKNIHPTNKQEVGRRLAIWALADTYGKEMVRCGPLYKSFRARNGRIRIQFDCVGEGLVAKDGEKLEGFAIAGEDKKFVWAEAKIGKKGVVVSSPEVPEPVAVRYAWAENPKFNLYNEAGLPASPFRTDEWEEPEE